MMKKEKTKNKEISINEVLDYGFCSMYYKYKYIDNLSDNNININKEYNEAIKKTIYGFLSSLQDNDLSFNTIKHIWGRIWIKQKDVINLIYQKPKTWRDSHNEKRKLGIYSLNNFYEFITKESNIPLIYNQPYNIKIGDISLMGEFEIIREINKSTQIIIIKNSNRNFNNIHLEKDLEVTATSLAFRKTFDTVEDDIVIFNSEKGNFKHTIRDEDDYKLLYNTVKKILVCINNNIFFACPNERCYNCLYRKICLEHI